MFQSLPEDATPPVNQANSYREVVSLQAIFVTLVVTLLAYIQKEPTFEFRADAMFALLASVPLFGLYNIIWGRTRTPDCDIYVCTRPVRAYARQALIMDLIIVVAISFLYWREQLPGQ